MRLRVRSLTGSVMKEQKVLFISCGQQTYEERKPGGDIIELVIELTSFKPDFAEEGSSRDDK
jgi:hypothetical protein